MWSLGSDNLQTMYDTYIDETTCPEGEETCNLSITPLEAQKKAFTLMHDSYVEVSNIAYWKMWKQIAYSITFGLIALLAIAENFEPISKVTCTKPTKSSVNNISTPSSSLEKIANSIISKFINRMIPQSFSNTSKEGSSMRPKERSLFDFDGELGLKDGHTDGAPLVLTMLLGGLGVGLLSPFQL